MYKQVISLAIAVALLLIVCSNFVGCQTEQPPTTPQPPTQVAITMHCIEVSRDYEVLDRGSFVLGGSYRYTGSDTVKLSIDTLQILDLTASTQNNYSLIVTPSPTGTVYEDWLGYLYFDKLRQVLIEINEFHDCAVIRVDDRLFVASTLEDFDPDAIRQEYEDLFSLFFAYFE